jgi:predicted nuclease with TOPRIM domain
MDAATLMALSGLITGVLGIVIAGLTQHSAASKAELESLRSTIETLQEENERLTERLDKYVRENGALREWAEALVCQVEELGGKPARFKIEDTRPR